MEKKILEGNKLIAEFMGAVKSKIDDDERYLRFKEPQAGTETFAFYPEDLKYHSSWSWLMPVVEKMSTIHYGWKDMETPYDDCAYPRTFGMLNAEGKPMVRFNSSQVFTGDALIEVTWLAVIDFIQWYKTQLPNP